MDWKRGVKSRTVAAERTTWESRCGRYQVILSHIPYAYDQYRGSVHLGYSDIYYAVVKSFIGWDVIHKHLKRGSAERTCEKHETDNSGTGARSVPLPSGGDRKRGPKRSAPGRRT